MKDLLCEKLIHGAQRGDVLEVSEMLEAGVNLNHPSRFGLRTALHEAAGFGNSDVALLLVSKGASLEAKDNDGMTPLHCASLDLAGQGRAAGVLIDSGASVDARDKDGKTPLHWMAMFDLENGVSLLLDAGANPLATDIDGKTAMDLTTAPAIQNILRMAEEREALSILSEEASRSASAASRRRI